MTEQDQIMAIAVMDGMNPDQKLPPYLESYDAIIPVIQKRPKEVRGLMMPIEITPAQLCESLLRLTGKWRD